jgi:hypothetical protein
MHDDQTLVTIETFENSFDAELGKLALENAGIAAVLVGQDLVGNLTYGVPSIMIELQVREADAVKAKQVLDEKEPLEDDDEA